MKEIDALKSEGIDLGKFTAAAERTGNFFGNTANPKVAKLNTRIKDVVAAFVALRSGAQVTEQEREMYNKIFSQIGRGYKLNKAVIEGLMTNVLVELNSAYTRGMGEEWGNYATQIQFEPGEIAPLEWVAPSAEGEGGEETEEPTSEAEPLDDALQAQITELLNEHSPEQVRTWLQEKNYPPEIIEQLLAGSGEEEKTDE